VRGLLGEKELTLPEGVPPVPGTDMEAQRAGNKRQKSSKPEEEL
jgi:hypothetical protein